MKVKTFVVATIAIVLSGCGGSKPSTTERIEKAFKDYVKTDFGNPDYFLGITHIGEPDTIVDCNKLKYFSDFVQTFDYKLKHSTRMDANKARQTLLSDTAYRILSYPIKVRQKSKEGLVVREYWVIDENGKMWAQDHEHTLDELPEFVRVIYEASVEITGE